MNNYNIDSISDERKDLLSSTITFLKFPLAVLVVILHADLITKPIERVGLSNLAINEPLYTNISWFLSRYMAYAAVPSFFIISGFLLLYNVKDYDKTVYLSKLSKRVKSLLVPYTLWCLIYLLLYWLIGQENILFSEVPNLFSGELSPIQLLVNIFIKPLDGPLWFIRNLFVMVVLSPVLYAIIRRTKYLVPLFFLLLTQVVHSPIVETVLWFTFGMSFAIHRFDFLYFCRKWMPVSIAITIGVFILDAILQPEQHFYGHFSIFKIMSVLGLGYWCIQKHRAWADNKVLNGSSFTIYAYHGLMVLLLPPVLLRALNGMLGGVIQTYFITILLVVVTGVLLSIIINKNKVIRTLLCGR